MKPARTQAPLAEVLPELLKERGSDQGKLAAAVGVSRVFLNRALNQRNGKRVSGELAGRVADALELPRDFFAEWREWVVLEAVRDDPELREQIYAALAANPDVR